MHRRDDHGDVNRLDDQVLDDLLRAWHDQSTERALRAEAGRPRVTPVAAPVRAQVSRPSIIGRLRPFVTHPGVRAAASLVILAVIAALLLPRSGTKAMADVILVPNGGRLEARDEMGNLVGPCALAHTDVDIAVSGPFARVTVRQKYHNPYERKIEAVYTFPLSHHGAVDRMTMTVGDRVVVGEVHERNAARQIYHAARAQGYVASLLEQERPNIFTQSVANIEPGAEITIEISYVELVPVVEGEYRLHFPMTVAPRYIPGYRVGGAVVALPAGLAPRHGVNLLGPARVVGLDETPVLPGTPVDDVSVTRETLIALLRGARPIRFERSRADVRVEPTGQERFVFEVEYEDGARERGRIFETGVGELNGRWFVLGPPPDPAGRGFSPNTPQVPDASRITPMPVRPDTRAGHAVSVDVTIDTGGPAITGYRSELHRLRERGAAGDGARGNLLRLTLENETEIPNRDFRLRWTVDESRIQEAIFVHRPVATEADPDPHGYLTMMLRPPARIDDADVRPCELVFVLDSSGSMKGFPIEKAQAVMQRAIDAMRPQDVFNVITFNEQTDVLWEAPRPATDENRAIAIERILARQGGGGTEMLPAVMAALEPRGARLFAAIAPERLANLPADGRSVEVRCPRDAIEYADGPDARLCVRDDLHLAVKLPAAPINLPGSPSTVEVVIHPPGPIVRLRGRWVTRDGRRVLDVVAYESDEPARALRCVFFLSDGEVGNDRAVVDAVRDCASGARVFTVGIGNSPNRSLLDEMAKAGRGASDYITLEGDADAAVETFVRRIGTPVLTDVELAFDGVEIADVLLPNGVELYDQRPLVAHGRYTEPGRATLTVRGVTGAGAYERKLDVELPAIAPDHDVIATHWARAKVDERLEHNDRDAVIAIGKAHSLLTPFTSFVAVERSRITVGGQPMLVTVPIEMPEGQSWEGTVGECRRAQLKAIDAADDDTLRQVARMQIWFPGLRETRAFRAVMGEPNSFSYRADKAFDPVVDVSPSGSFIATPDSVAAEKTVGLVDGLESVVVGQQFQTLDTTFGYVGADLDSYFVSADQEGAIAFQSEDDVKLGLESFRLDALRYELQPHLAMADVPLRSNGRAAVLPAQRRKETAIPRVLADVDGSAGLAAHFKTAAAGVTVEDGGAAARDYYFGVPVGPGAATDEAVTTALQSTKLDAMPLGTLRSALDQVAKKAAVLVRVDWNALQAMGVTADDPVTIEGGTPADAGLRQLMSQIGRDSAQPLYFITNGGVLVTTETAQRERGVQARAADLSRLLSLAGPESSAFDEIDVMLVVLGRLVRADADADAQLLAETLVAAHSGDVRVLDLKFAIGDTWDDGTRERIAALADVARARIETQMVKWEEQVLLRRVVHESLLPVVTGETTETPPSLDVSVLVTDPEGATRRALEQAGLDVHGRAGSRPIVVGTIASSRLRELALLDVVRRVEPLALHAP